MNHQLPEPKRIKTVEPEVIKREYWELTGYSEALKLFLVRKGKVLIPMSEDRVRGLFL
jgi:hypothetical protein